MWIAAVVVLSLLTGGAVYWLSLRTLGEHGDDAAPRLGIHDRARSTAAIAGRAGVEGWRWFLARRRNEPKDAERIIWDDGPASQTADASSAYRPGEHVVVVPIGADPPSTKSRVLGLLGIVVLVAVGGALTALAVWQTVILVVRQIDRYFAST